MIRAAWRNSISTAWTSDSTIATTPNISTTAGAAPPPRFSSRVSRWVNWPPVETCSTHADQASPALSSSVAAVTPSVLAAARVSRPPVTSSSGLARRVSAIRAPAAITPATATAAVTGSSHRWMCGDRGLAGQVRGGDPQPPGGRVRHDPRDPVGDRLRDAAQHVTGGAARSTDWITLPATQAGSVNGLQGMTSPLAREGGVAGQGGDRRRGAGPVATGRGDHPPVAAQPDGPGSRVAASTVVPLLAGPSVTMSTVGGLGRVAWSAGRRPRRRTPRPAGCPVDVRGGAQRGVVAVVRGQQEPGVPGRSPGG